MMIFSNMHKTLAAAALISSLSTVSYGQDTATLQGSTLLIASDRAACRLVHLAATADAVHRLPLSGLCTFHRDKAGALRVMKTKDGPVFLIETSALQTGSKQDCETRVLAVRLTAGGPKLAPSPAKVSSCVPFHWDDAMFLGSF